MRAQRKAVAGILLTAVLLTNPEMGYGQDGTLNYGQQPFYKVSNFLNRLFDLLDEDEMRKHYATLFTALDNLNNGEVARWYSDTSGNHGAVQIAATTISRGQICRRVYVNIVTTRRGSNYESWACLNREGNWNFSDR